MHNLSSIFETFHLMRRTVRRKMSRECTIHSEKVAIQFINLHRPTIWRCQIGRASSQHSVCYPCFTKQERKPLSILGCSEWRIPLACWWPICIISFKRAFSYCTSFKRVGGKYYKLPSLLDNGEYSGMKYSPVSPEGTLSFSPEASCPWGS